SFSGVRTERFFGAGLRDYGYAFDQKDPCDGAAAARAFGGIFQSFQPRQSKIYDQPRRISEFRWAIRSPRPKRWRASNVSRLFSEAYKLHEGDERVCSEAGTARDALSFLTRQEIFYTFSL